MAFPKRHQDEPAKPVKAAHAKPAHTKATSAKPAEPKAASAKAAQAKAAPRKPSTTATGEHAATATERAPARPQSDYILIALLITAAFLGSYSYALSVSASRAGQGAGSSVASASPAPQGSLDPNAKLENGVQTLYIDAANGFNPQTVFAKADIPLKIRFGQGQGCYSAVQFPAFNVYKDLTQGGAEIDLGKLKPGQYQFACGMNMAYGLLVVK